MAREDVSLAAIRSAPEGRQFFSAQTRPAKAIPMPTASRRIETLDDNIVRTLRTSLAQQVVRMFALIGRAGGGVTREKKVFVADFFDNLYPVDISNYFCNRFEEYIARPTDLERFADQVNARLTYREKIFCLLTIYEFIVAVTTRNGETKTARELAALMKVDPADAAFIEDSFGVRRGDPAELARSNILSLRITGDMAAADLFLPLPGLDLVVYKIQNIYCLTKKNDLYKVTAQGRSLVNNFSSSISSHFNLKVGDYSLRHQDLIICFRNKVNALNAEVFVAEQGLELGFEYERTEKSLVRLSVKGSNITLDLLDKDSIAALNGRRIEDSAHIDLNDMVYVNGFRLNPREIFYFLNTRREIALGPGKDGYQVTNDIKGDIFILDDMPDKWSARILIGPDGGMIADPGDCPYQMYLSGKPLQMAEPFGPGDVLYVHDNFIEIDPEAGVFRKSVFSFRKLVADSIRYTFEGGKSGVDEVSFGVDYGEMVCILGPSGSGKSTLLNLLSGLCVPDSGTVTIDGQNLHARYPEMKDHIGYVPQDDLLLANLSVYENLYYHARLRFPDRSEEELGARIGAVLDQIKLADKSSSRVGQPVDKILSGGERKRLNIGLELLADAEIYFLDEPTSGLSSKDSENILEILSSIAMNGKIVVAVIHQPSSRLYKKFNKVVLLDHGGSMAFFGDAFEALEYFKRHMEAGKDGEKIAVECPACKSVQPDILLDSLEDSLRDIDGSVLGERKYSPQYWKRKYRRTVVASWFSNIRLPKKDILPPAREMAFGERFNQFTALFARNFKCKVRDRSNLLITFLEAPLLGAGLGFILKYAPNDDYSLYTNDLFRTYIFIAVIVAIFLSMTNSVDEIIADTALFMRERMLNSSHRAYLAAKILVLMLFSIAQNVLFVVLGFIFLEVRELYLEYIIFLSLLSFTGISLGLFISSIPKLSSKAASNIVPLVLIPQIILGGALIEYEKMNVNLRLYKKSPIPEICQSMPSRWAYEGLMILQETGNSYDARHTELTERIKELKYKHEEIIAKHGEEYYKRKIDGMSDELEEFRRKYKHAYGNKNIHDAVIVGERTLKDNISSGQSLRPDYSYPMFVREKRLPLIETRVSTVYYNGLVLLLMAIIVNFASLFMLRYREKMIWGSSKVARLVALMALRGRNGLNRKKRKRNEGIS